MFRSHRSRLPKYLSAFIVAITLFLGLWLPPTIAQTLVTVPVVLDGQQLFEISSSGQYSAQERAKLINSQLRSTVQSSQPIQVRIEQRNQLPTILLNDRYLLTVTEQDAVPGSTPNEQAITWVQLI